MTNSSSLSRAETLLWTLCAMAVICLAWRVCVDPRPWEAAALTMATVVGALGLVCVRRARRSFVEIAAVLDNAARGDLEMRVILLDDAGEIAALAKSVNRILDTSDAFVRETRATLECIRDGRYHRRIVERGMVGTFGAASRTMNEAVSTLAKRLSGFSEVMQAFERTVGGVTGSLTTAVDGLARSAGTMRSSASDTVHRTSAIGASAEETSSTVATIAAATEELNAAVESIAGQAERALQISDEAGRGARVSRQAIADLTHAVGDIGGVLDLIRQVAEQTKLLALNATIEAARAGEAGRGFGVVATEVKALAGQTASATEAIAQGIRAVEERAARCMESIDGITGVVEEIASAASAIASSVKEQITATQEISHSMQMASNATDAVSANVGSVAAAAGETGRAAHEVADASTQLAEQSNRLRTSVETFMESARAITHTERAA